MDVSKKPRVGGAVLLEQDGKFLIGRRNKKIGNGKWIIPGGGVEWGEKIQDAAVREFKEETGITVEITNFIGWKEILAIDHDYHAIVFFYLAKRVSGELVATDDISEAHFFTVDEIKKLDHVESVQWVFEQLNLW